MIAASTTMRDNGRGTVLNEEQEAKIRPKAIAAWQRYCKAWNLDPTTHDNVALEVRDSLWERMIENCL